MQTDQVKSVGGTLDSVDEITLVDLVLILWRKRKIALLAGCIPLIATVVYLLSVVPVYRASSYIQAPLEQDITALNTRHQGAVTYKAKDVYAVFLKNLNSKDLRRQFFRQQNLSAYYAGDSFEGAFQSQFNHALTVDLSQKDSLDITLVSFESGDPRRTAEWLNLYIEQVRVFTVNELIGEVSSNIQGRKQWLRDQIEGKRRMFKEQTQYEIRYLEEALRIAKKLGIRQPSDFIRLQGGGFWGAQAPLYFRGSAALEAELKVLKSRKVDDRLITEMRDLQAELTWLESIEIQPDSVRILRIDQPAITPEQPARPNRKMIMVVGIMIAGIFALLAAFSAHFISVFRRELRRKIT